jgi:hypothetical protein
MTRLEGPGQPVPMVIVQHAHQHLVTEGYPNREGVLELYRALSGLLRCHLEREVPLALHLSGTLVEAMAWHVPELAGCVRAAHEEGLLELVGSAYAQNVLPLFSDEMNRRQLTESLALYERHFGVAPEQIRCLWVPERVWDTERLAALVSDEALPNGGYRTVLLDDRHAYPMRPGAADGPSRHDFDEASAPARAHHGQALDHPLPAGDGRQLRPYRLADGSGLVVMSLSSELRYCFPPRDEATWQHVARVVASARAAGPGAVLAYGDDAERSVGVGAWGPRGWTPDRLAVYADTLSWLAAASEVEPVLPSAWLAQAVIADERPVEPAAFYELATDKGAGEDYRLWWDDPAWRPYRERLERVSAELAGRRVEPGGLWDSAWKQLLVSTYETAWHERDADGVVRPTPWARAVAAHAAEAMALAAAASAVETASIEEAAWSGDLDGDGEDEVVLSNRALFVVVSPRWGGRITLACDLLQPGGRVLVGNPTDDWNWQEEPGRFMEQPRNHPGALADVGHENDRHRVLSLRRNAGSVCVVLVNVQEGSPLWGVRKTLTLRRGAHQLEVVYDLPTQVDSLAVECALSPDYLLLLRGGRANLERVPITGADVRAFRAGQTTAWLRLTAGDPVIWDRPEQPKCGHAVVVRVLGYGRRFQLDLGRGEPLAVQQVDTSPVMAAPPRLVPAARAL